MKLLKGVHAVASPVQKKIKKRLKEFSSFSRKDSKEWFSELCFCILTANAKAKTGISVQKILGYEGFSSLSFEALRDTIKENKHRFHNTKATRIIEVRKYRDIKKRIQKKVNQEGQEKTREWLVSNIKGYGYKEASHFLRNVGYFDLAILDRHILNLMKEHRIIKDIPKSMTQKNYLLLEQKFKKLAHKAKMNCGELDLYMWYLKAGDVLK